MVTDVTIYTTKYCPYCIRALHFLRGQKDLEIKEISVDTDRDVRQEMMRLSGQRSVPQIWVGTEHVGGCDELMGLSRNGALKKLLAEQKK